jgi:hypothetical protein
MGDHRGAAEGFRDAITWLLAGFHRDRGVYLGRESVALARSGEAEHAAVIGMQALNVARSTGSDRIARELAQLDGILDQWRAAPGVADFKEVLTEAVLHQA